MTKEEFMESIRPAGITDAFGHRVIAIYTIRPGQRWTESKYIFGIVSSTEIQMLGLQELVAYLKGIKEKMYKHFLKEYNNNADDVVVFKGPVTIKKEDLDNESIQGYI